MWLAAGSASSFFSATTACKTLASDNPNATEYKDSPDSEPGDGEMLIAILGHAADQSGLEAD
jgi:hypothetical protein